MIFVPVEPRSDAELTVEELTAPMLLIEADLLTGFLRGDSEPSMSLEEPLRRR